MSDVTPTPAQIEWALANSECAESYSNTSVGRVTHGCVHHGNEWPCPVALDLATKVAALVRDERAEAWDRGYTSGHSRAMRRMSDEPNVEPGVNPYRDGNQAAAVDALWGPILRPKTKPRKDQQ